MNGRTTPPPEHRPTRDGRGTAPGPVLIGAAEVGARVAELADELAPTIAEPPVVAVVLDGGVVFAADLVRALAVDLEVAFLALQPFAPGAGRARLAADLDLPVTDRDVLLVEGVIDTGLELQFLLRHLELRSPRRVRTVTLLDRPGRRLVPVPVDLVGFTVDDGYVVGYGLGLAGRHRHLPALHLVDPGAVAEVAEPPTGPGTVDGDQ